MDPEEAAWPAKEEVRRGPGAQESPGQQPGPGPSPGEAGEEVRHSVRGGEGDYGHLAGERGGV